jgi:hypothetical protein
MSAFIKLKKALCTQPVLAFPKPNIPFVLATDASAGDDKSPGGIAGVLSQVGQDSLEHVVAYCSRTLKPHEKNYSTMLLETFAASFAIQHFSVFLHGVKFKLLVDHKPMETLNTIHRKTFNRLQELMTEYNFIVEYRPGNKNQVADALSRNAVDSVSAINAMGLSDDNLRELQRKDPFVRQVFYKMNEQVHHGPRP